MISASDFESSVGQTFTVDAGGTQLRLELHAVRPLSSSARPGGGFSLQFKGPRNAALQQATYRFVGADFADDIFIVPVSADATAVFYEAVFN
ncbi:MULTISPECIES: DUF6916 family protein [Aminobacter]|jgi:hypothetical protein|uniref:DUF6916 domain-containing protein n=2 Tax=Aminobacter TaxID=31988 RepID=A0AAC8YW32_AMIAI|nr:MULTISPECIES: hypothetical protein [Aminobacter]AMS44871.1 hypothetical protein AA2016_5966 [Aminobacter aminovorans]MBA8907640.1 hypothetical protein [Aminobacter ciceronei]MBA9021510.1 hypothetical protein [Aminobacter ciceronei]MBB3704334.1 hypothetical protein [Aminobacter aminovorans]MRX32426.1 hypothetical protein [Aminobacter sp. MDW-2]